ncbi:YqgE/AlgH family protein [Sedimenticola hydrogenitrophicus]|uniref:YqgE/AlgH family protein n=1 Tax=Sedimenticola hydrogenitrophicus TaxID=2967975 RepID=UPI0023B02DCF|nr:YqgE/AlgH family protein [Sedimenticola hydrogenitrophicus]
MNSPVSLTNQFLIAMPRLDDANFHHTVTYLCQHGEEGAMGIVINRPSGLRLNDILDQLDINDSTLPSAEQPIFIGGPVQTDRGFVLHTSGGTWESTLRITSSISITTSRDILDAIARGKGPAKSLIALGYAGWGVGQLEQEMSANAWLNGPAPESVLFDLPAEARWEAAAQAIGIDLNLLSGDAGHA